MSEFRPLEERERKILDRLVEHEFQGHEELRSQVESVTARLILEHHDNYGSIELRVANATPANVKYRVPVEGQFMDDDGIPVWVMLHVSHAGTMCELEIVRADGRPLISTPVAERLEVY